MKPKCAKTKYMYIVGEKFVDNVHINFIIKVHRNVKIQLKNLISVSHDSQVVFVSCQLFSSSY